jgi:type I restriction enzyme S subunit
MMAVDSLRDTYHVNRVQPADFEINWAAQAYRPEIIRAIHDAKSIGPWKTLEEITGGAITQGRTPVYSEKGVPCLKTRHVLGIEINRNDPDRVSPEFAAAHSNLRLLRNDIVLNRSGVGSVLSAAQSKPKKIDNASKEIVGERRVVSSDV